MGRLVLINIINRLLPFKCGIVYENREEDTDMSITAFDTLAFTEGLTAVDVPEKQAKVQD
jgi:hypothetical protein